MKTLTRMLTGILLVAVCLATAQAEEALRANVEALYQKLDRAFEVKDLDTVMTCYTSDFALVFAGPNCEQLREMYQKQTAEYTAFRITRTIESVEPWNKMVKVLTQATLEGKATGSSEWKELSKGTKLDFARRDGNAWKFCSSADVKKELLSAVHDQRYTNETLGVSFSVCPLRLASGAVAAYLVVGPVVLGRREAA